MWNRVVRVLAKYRYVSRELQVVTSQQMVTLTFNGRSAPIGAAMSKVKMDEVYRFAHAGI
jgi:hypothetical protein